MDKEIQGFGGILKTFSVVRFLVHLPKYNLITISLKTSFKNILKKCLTNEF
jgi:hypothetical protein